MVVQWFTHYATPTMLQFCLISLGKKYVKSMPNREFGNRRIEKKTRETSIYLFIYLFIYLHYFNSIQSAIVKINQNQHPSPFTVTNHKFAKITHIIT